MFEKETHGNDVTGIITVLNGLQALPGLFGRIGQQLGALNSTSVRTGAIGANVSTSNLPNPPKTPASPPAPPQPLMPNLMDGVGSKIASAGKGMVQEIAPLIGEAIGTIAPELGAVLGPIGEAGQSVVTSFKSLFDAANKAASTLTTFASAMVTSGGTGQEQGRLNAFGGALGLSGQDLSQLSRTLAHNLATSGVAASMGQKAGIYDYGNPFMQLDKAKNLEKAFDYIASSRTPLEQATVAARAWGIESALLARNLDQQTRLQLKASGELQASINSPQLVKAAGAFNAQLSRITGAIGGIGTLIGGQIMQLLTPFLEIGANAAESIARILNLGLAVTDFITGPIRALTQVLVDLASFNLDKAKTDINNILNGTFFRDPAKDLKDATDNLLQATKQGTFGGGDRARGAVPGGLTGMNFNVSWGWGTADAARMGAFAGG